MSDLLENKFVRSFKFDHPSSNLCVGTKDGIQLINYSNPTELRCSKKLAGLKAYLIELVPDHDILIYVPDEARRKLVFHYFGTLDRKEIEMKGIDTEEQFKETIIRIKCTPGVLLIACENALYVHAGFRDQFGFRRRIGLSETISENVVDLAFRSVYGYIAYPNLKRIGHIIVVDIVQPDKSKDISAHDNAIAAIALDLNGRIVASASETGVIIKVHRTFNCECVYEFKRGVTLDLTITSLSFSEDGKLIWAQDTSQYLKIYKIGYQTSVAANGSNWFLEKLQRIVQSVLPENATNWLFQQDPFASVEHIVDSDCKITCTIYKNDAKYVTPHFLVASTDGLVYAYSINAIEGGSCRLLKCYSIEEEKYVDLPQNAANLKD